MFANLGGIIVCEFLPLDATFNIFQISKGPSIFPVFT